MTVRWSLNLYRWERATVRWERATVRSGVDAKRGMDGDFLVVRGMIQQRHAEHRRCAVGRPAGSPPGRDHNTFIFLNVYLLERQGLLTAF
jgi:hypothetical protein